jgi:outer membrane protein TolC
MVQRVVVTGFALALTLSCIVPGGAPALGATPAASQLRLAPTPSPLPSVLPYPAYGTPAPDVAQRRAAANVPQKVNVAQATDIAVIDSPAYANERAIYQTARARYYAEKGALLPSISAGGSVTRDFDQSRIDSGSGASPSPAPAGGHSISTTFNASINIQQLIFDGGRAIAAIKAASENNIAGRDTLLRDLQTLENTVAKAYYAVLASDATVTADANLVREFQTQENSIRASIRAGSAARSDLASAQYQTAKARGALVAAQGQQIAAQSAFATTIGLDPDTLIQPVETSAASPAVPAQPTYAKSLAQALLQRADYMAAQHAVASANQNLRYAKLARMPTITANASAGTSKSEPFEPKWSPSGSIGASISIPIYDQGLTNYNIASAAAALDQANAALTSTKLGVESDVRSGLANLFSARAQLVQARLEVQSARVSLDAANAQYHVGVATIVDIVTAEANLAQAQTDYVSALYGLRTAEENYNFAVGVSDLKL